MKWILRDEFCGNDVKFTEPGITDWYVATSDKHFDCAVLGVFKRDGVWHTYDYAAVGYAPLSEVATLEEAQAYAEISFRMRSST